ncbi:MAG: hypothetical protein ABI721_04000 [Candidatus Dojkabacteria bacterium]
MKDISKKIFAISTLVFSLFSLNNILFAMPVHAQNLICTIFPFIQNLGFGAGTLCGDQVDGSVAVGAGVSLVRLALQLIFIGIIVVSIYIIIRAAIKYIRSEGDDTKIQEAQKAIKSVFIGIAALFIGIIGIVIILAFFNASVGGDLNEINNVIPNTVKPNL